MAAPFNLDDFLPYLLNQAAEVASMRFAAIYRDRYGMHRTDWRVLAHLGQWGQMSAVEICRRAAEEKTKVSRAVVRLENKGFITRLPNHADRRSETLRLTDIGHEVYRDLSDEAVNSDRAMNAELGGAVAKSLRDALKMIASKSD